MSRTTSVNFSSPSFPIADDPEDGFLRADVQQLAAAVDAHDHTAGKGVATSGGGRELVYEQTLSSPAAFALATGWTAPTDGQRLEIEIYGALAATSGWRQLTMQIGDATSLKTSGYRTMAIGLTDTGGNATQTSGTSGYVVPFLNGNQGAGTDLSQGISSAWCTILDAGGTLAKKYWNAQGFADYGGAGPVGQTLGWGIVTCGAVTRLQIGNSASVNFVAGSRIRVYLSS